MTLAKIEKTLEAKFASRSHIIKMFIEDLTIEGSEFAPRTEASLINQFNTYISVIEVNE